MAAPNKAALVGHWIHSHEEDHAGAQVYRRQGFSFPRARGRAGFELRDSHVWLDFPIAAADGNDRFKGHWELSPTGELRLTRAGDQHAERVLQVLSLEPDRIVVQEKADGSA